MQAFLGGTVGALLLRWREEPAQHIKKPAIAGLVLAGLAVAPLTGCGDGKDAPPPVGTPVASSPSTPKPSTSTSPTPPPEAMKNTKDGAEAFIRWYLVRQWDAVTTRDASLLAPYTSQECKGCKAVGRAAEQRTAEGTDLTGTFAVNSVKMIPVSGAKAWVGQVSGKITELSEVSHGKPSPMDDNDYTASLTIAYQAEGWTVVQLVE